MLVIQSIYTFVTYGVTAAVVAAIVLILLRALFNYRDVNPFNWSARTVRRVTDPVIMPVRRSLVSFGIDPRAAPFIAVLLIILVGYFVVLVVGGVLNTVAGVIYAVSSKSVRAPVAIIGYLLYGFLGLYTLMIFIRIIFHWFGLTYGNPVMRFFIRTTEPLLGPLRRITPPVGRFDISPIVGFILLWLLQAVVAGTLLRDWRTSFF